MNIQQILNERLEDISTINQNYHYTNSDTLPKILKSGYIMAFDCYPAKSIDGKNVYEIATVRKSKDNELNALKKTDPYAYKSQMNSLSARIGNVKFILFTDRIKSGLKNAKVKPLAELPKEAMKEIDSSKKNLIDYLIKKGYEKHYVEKDIDKIVNSEEFYIKKYERNFIEKYELSETNAPLWNLVFNVKKMRASTKKREGEERISLNNEKGIPIDERFMKIELLSGFEKEINLGDDFISYFKKYDNLFVKNKVYNAVMEKISVINNGASK